MSTTSPMEVVVIGGVAGHSAARLESPADDTEPLEATLAAIDKREFIES